MDDESEIVRKNIGLYFKNMQDLHNMDMIYVQIGEFLRGWENDRFYRLDKQKRFIKANY